MRAFKPTGVLGLDKRKRLARGLRFCIAFNENAGLISYDLSGNGNDVVLTANAAWTTTIEGVQAQTATNKTLGQIAGVASWQVPDAITILMRGAMTSGDMWYSCESGSAGFGIYNGLTPRPYMRTTKGGGTWEDNGGGSLLSAGQIVTLVQQLGGGTYRTYQDKTQTASVADTGTVVYSAAIPLTLNAITSGDVQASTLADTLFMGWDWFLPLEDVFEMNDNPFGIFVPPARIYPVYKASGGGPITVAPNPAAATAAVVAPTVVLSSLTLALSPAAGAAAVVAPSVVLGSLVITPSPASAGAAVVAPTLVLSSVVVSPSPAAAAAAIVAPTVVSSSISFTPNPALAATTVIAPTVVQGAIAYTPSPANATAVSVAPSLILSLLLVAPNPASGAAASIAPAIILGSIAYTPAPSSAVATTVAPTVLGQNISLTPDPAAAATSRIAPQVIAGSLLLQPNPATGRTVSLDPTLLFGSVVITSSIATARTGVVNPTVVDGAPIAGSGIPTICPPVTPDWELLLITDSLVLSPAGWDAPAVVDDDLDS